MRVMIIEYAAWWIIGTLALAVTAYVVVRAGALGHFRTKREHFDYVKREVGGEGNGEAK